MTCSIQPLVDAALPNTTVVLPDGEYDDAAPVVISKNLTIQGSRNAVVHSEFYISSAVVRFDGFTLEMNKEGAPARDGVSTVYPQNGMVTVLGGATLWADDLEVHLVPGLTGYALQKNAFHVVGSVLQLRAVTQFSRVDWRNSTYQVIELLYNSYANIFDVSGQGVAMNIVANTANSPLGAGGAAIQVMGSKVTLSGANMFNNNPSGPNPPSQSGVYGISAGRDSYVQIGAGRYTTVQGFGPNNALVLDPTSHSWVAPGSQIN